MFPVNISALSLDIYIYLILSVFEICLLTSWTIKKLSSHVIDSVDKSYPKQLLKLTKSWWTMKTDFWTCDPQTSIKNSYARQDHQGQDLPFFSIMFRLRQLQQLLQSQPLGALRLAAKLVRTNSTLAATFGLEAVWGWTRNWFSWRWMGSSTNLKNADSWWPSERIDRYVLVQSDWIRWSCNSWHAMCLSDCPFHHSLSSTCFNYIEFVFTQAALFS